MAYQNIPPMAPIQAVRRRILEVLGPFRLRRMHANRLGELEAEAPVVAGITEQNNCWRVEGVGGGENRMHKSVTDAAALVACSTPSGPSPSEG